ncbi:hypothetical protein FC83_GL002979 [Agrilactobacillus composti DSM 18527 = JCM 14202]|uniref:Uncharacterized protein n=1 Tax=Agrilactobacillus composti DSM 18527 = JCM 14202 TaxID=1423734 RepID=X0QN01_9LACO|nr:hypothetical protein FC83_GL002979 [Agrilactobacillus composti DSM 18527 = JCM 14202]GAF39965.1 hypothetical protein JCM14202_1847 [Agrilactobacillus composti DSM 18527 = JCM 14202]
MAAVNAFIVVQAVGLRQSGKGVNVSAIVALVKILTAKNSFKSKLVLAHDFNCGATLFLVI